MRNLEQDTVIKVWSVVVRLAGIWRCALSAFMHVFVMFLMSMLFSSFVYAQGLLFSSKAPSICRSDAAYVGEKIGVAGPWDYTVREPKYRWLVEDVTKNHIDKDTKSQLRAKKPRVSLLFGGIVYTLDRVPNHYEALRLFSVVIPKFGRERYDRIMQVVQASGNRPYEFPASPECFFERAINWRPRDPALYLLYGIFLHKTGELESARELYDAAVKLAPKWAEAHYNLGLLLVELEQYDAAAEQEEIARKLGYPLTGLRKMLQQKVH